MPDPSYKEMQPDETDAQLIAKAKAGDQAAFGRLVTQYYQRVFHLAMTIVRNETDALDLAQEVFVKAWLNLAKFEGKSAFFTWLYRITHNLGIDHLRKHNRYAMVDFDEIIPSEESDAPVESQLVVQAKQTESLEKEELRNRIDEAMAKLSPEHRTVLVLREFDELDYQEIAKIMECSTGTVMSRIYYARKHLKKLLKGVVS
ncbi:MAG: sigma-70 family RNA polymerase sigma factor [Verrucomicrobiota bacterium]|nr:sigma-70 family RNA polymerase sigma factor [Verrucomicrobiota bacterium]